MEWVATRAIRDATSCQQARKFDSAKAALMDICPLKRQGRLPTGKAVITTGGNLKAKYVIHTVGQIWYGGTKNEAKLLTSAYQESLKLASEHNLASISFPSISTGAYGYPIEDASEVAIKAVSSFLKPESTSIKAVVFVLFDSATYEQWYVLEKISEAKN